jgi:hypothetical protein
MQPAVKSSAGIPAGVLAALQDIVQKEGLLALWKGPMFFA